MTARKGAKYPYLKKVSTKPDVWQVRRRKQIKPRPAPPTEWDQLFSQVRYGDEAYAKAVEYHDAIDAEIHRGEKVIKRGSLTVQQAVDENLEILKVLKRSDTTISNYRLTMYPLTDTHPDLPLDALEARHMYPLIRILRDKGWMRKDGKPGVVWPVYRTNYFQKIVDQMLVRNGRPPLGMEKTPIPKEEKSERPTFTDAEAKFVLKKAEFDPWKVAWRLALLGFRRGEICGLMWKDIDLDNEVFHVRRQRRYDGETNRVVVARLKSEKSNRSLPMPAALIADLRIARDLQDLDRKLMGTDYQDSGYVVVDEMGVEPSPQVVADTWERMLKRLGMWLYHSPETGDDIPRTLHTGRHTAITLWLYEGKAKPDVARFVGHADTRTLDTYTHSQDHHFNSMATGPTANL